MRKIIIRGKQKPVFNSQIELYDIPQKEIKKIKPILIDKSKHMEHFYEKIQGWFDYADLYSEIVKTLPNNSIFVEIGVWKGRSLSYFVVESINSGKKIDIHAVDTWLGSQEHKNDPLLRNPNDLFNHFLKNIEPIKNHIKIIRKPSIEAAKDFDDNSLDAIFVDASHEYQDVLNDLNAWLPKMKQNNIKIYGHDVGWQSVLKAINEFTKAKKLKLNKVSRSCYLISGIGGFLL